MIAAVQAGADVYVQKPIGVDVVECQAMVAAARKHERVVQVGTQRRSTPHLIEARELIQEGRLGRIGLVETYCYGRRGISNPPDEPPPETLDYEMWTGPAPMRPFNKSIHPRGWRSYMEYGNGTIGDMGIHMIDMARWMMDLGWPKRISSTGGNYFHKEGKPNISDMQTATLRLRRPADDLAASPLGREPDPKYWWGATFYGEKGTLKASVYGFDFTPLDGGTADPPRVERRGRQVPGGQRPVSGGQDRERDRVPRRAGDPRTHEGPAGVQRAPRPAARRYQRGLHLHGACVLANLSLQLGRSLAWDADKGQVAGDEEANRLLARPYRAPWVHPTPDKV